MRRTIIQLDDETWRRLRERAFRQHRSMAWLVREFVAQGLEGEGPRPPARAIRFASVRAGRSAPARRRVSVSEDHDEALADALRK